MFAACRHPAIALRRWLLACALAWCAVLGHGLQVGHLLGHAHVYCAEHGRVEHRHATDGAECSHGCHHHGEADGGEASSPGDGDHEACDFPELGVVPHGPALPTSPLPQPWQDACEALQPARRTYSQLAPLSYAPSRSPPLA